MSQGISLLSQKFHDSSAIQIDEVEKKFIGALSFESLRLK